MDTRPSNPVSGASQSTLRNHNERLILSMIRAREAMPASDLARQSNLSAQTVSVILRDLEQDGLLCRNDPVRGKVGKPSTPMTLDPDGAFGIGILIGRRSVEIALMDLCGEVRASRWMTHRIPVPEPIFSFIETALKEVLDELPRDRVERVCGIGLASPFEIWNWDEIIGTSSELRAEWRTVNYGQEIERFSPLPLIVMNDSTAACRAEQYLSKRLPYRNFVYFYMGAFIGGGIVLNGAVFDGAQGNAAALGSMISTSPDGRTAQLLDLASTHLLERDVEAAGGDPARLWDLPQDWSAFEAEVGPWITACGHAIAQAGYSACAVVDFEAIAIDGAFPVSVRARLTDAVRAAIPNLDGRGIVAPCVVEGTAGGDARVRGAAYAPISSEFFLDTALL